MALPPTGNPLVDAGAALLSLVGGKKPKGPERRGDELGLNHPGVDQARLRADPLYAEAARRANEAHIAAFTIPFAAVDRTPIDAVRASIEAEYVTLQAQGWRASLPAAPGTPWAPSAPPLQAALGTLGVQPGGALAALLPVLLITVLALVAAMLVRKL